MRMMHVALLSTPPQRVAREIAALLFVAALAYVALTTQAEAAFETPDTPQPIPCFNPSTPDPPDDDPDCDPAYADSWLGELALDGHTPREGDVLTLTWTPYFADLAEGGSADPRDSRASWSGFVSGSFASFFLNPLSCVNFTRDCTMRVVRGGFAPQPDDSGATPAVPWTPLSVSIVNGIGPANEAEPIYIQPSYYWAQFRYLDTDGTPIAPANGIGAHLTRRAGAGEVYEGETLGDVLLRYRLYQLSPASAIVAFGNANPAYAAFVLGDVIPAGAIVVPEAEPVVVAGAVASNIAKQHLRVGTYDVRFTDNAGRYFEPLVFEVTNDNLDQTIQAGPDPLEVVDVRVVPEVNPLAPFGVAIDVQNVSDDIVDDVRPVLLASVVPTGAGGIATGTPTPAVLSSLAAGEVATFTVVLTPNQAGRATLGAFARGIYRGANVRADTVSRMVRLGNSDLVTFWRLSAEGSDLGDEFEVPGPGGQPVPAILVLPGDQVQGELIAFNAGDTTIDAVGADDLVGALDLIVTGPEPAGRSALPPGAMQVFTYDFDSPGGDHTLTGRVSGSGAGTPIVAEAFALIDTAGMSLLLQQEPSDIPLGTVDQIIVEVRADDIPLVDVTVEGPTQTGGSGGFFVFDGTMRDFPRIEPFESETIVYNVLRNAEGPIEWIVTAAADPDTSIYEADEWNGAFEIYDTMTDSVRGKLQPSSYKIILDVPPGFGGDEFMFSDGFNPPFTLTSPTAGSAETEIPVVPGLFPTTQMLPFGWKLLDIVCNDPDGGTSVDIETATALIDVDSGEVVTCTYFNAPEAVLTLSVVFPDGVEAPALPFTGDLGDFEVDEAGISLPVAADTYQLTELVPDGIKLSDIVCVDPDGGSSTNVDTATATVDADEGESLTCTFFNEQMARIEILVDRPPGFEGAVFPFTASGDLGDFVVDMNGAGVDAPPGSYTITELVPEGWEVTGITCVDPDDETTTDVDGAAVTIDLDPDEQVRCTFFNDVTSSIRIGVEAPSEGPAQQFMFDGDGGIGAFSVAGPGGAVEEFPLLPGTYDVREMAPAGFTVTDIVCADADGGTTTDVPDARATIDLDADETVTCTFVNEPSATIVIAVDVPLGSTAAVFHFAAGGLDAFSIATPGQVPTEISAAAGSYTITEIIPAGFALTDIECSDPDLGTTVAVGSATATIDLDDGETVTCTFRNGPAAGSTLRLRFTVFGHPTEILATTNGNDIEKNVLGGILAGVLGERKIDLLSSLTGLQSALDGTLGANDRIADDVSDLHRGFARMSAAVDEIVNNQMFPPPGQVADASLSKKETTKLERGTGTIFEQLTDALAQAEHLPHILDSMLAAEIEPLVAEPAPEDLPFRLQLESDALHFDAEGRLGAITSDEPDGILGTLCLSLDDSYQGAPGIRLPSGFTGVRNAIEQMATTKATSVAALTLEPSERAQSNHAPMMNKMERKLEKADKGLARIGNAVREQLVGNTVLDDKTQRKAESLGALLRDSFNELGQTRTLMERLPTAVEGLGG